MMRAMMILLDDDTYAALEAMALEDIREPGQQAAWLIREGLDALERAGVPAILPPVSYEEDRFDRMLAELRTIVAGKTLASPQHDTHLRDSSMPQGIACGLNIFTSSTTAPGCVSCPACRAIRRAREDAMLDAARAMSLEDGA